MRLRISTRQVVWADGASSAQRTRLAARVEAGARSAAWAAREAVAHLLLVPARVPHEPPYLAQQDLALALEQLIPSRASAQRLPQPQQRGAGAGSWPSTAIGSPAAGPP